MTRSGSERRAPLLRRAHTRASTAVGPRGPASATPPRTAVDDLALTRLLSIARLTPAQAVALGTDLLAALADPDPAAGTPLRPEAMRVGRDGRARLIETRQIHEATQPSTLGAGLASFAVVLDRIRAATRASTAAGGLIRALERAATEARSPDGRVAIVAAILREADAAGGVQARVELSRLVAMATPDAGPAPRASGPRRRRPRRSPHAIARAVAARSWKWVLSLMVLVAAVVIEIIFLRDDISRDVLAVMEAGRPDATATGTPPALPPVVAAAPTAAGAISRIDVRQIQPCASGADCALRVQVMVRPHAEPRTIAWDLRILDRCTGESVTAPGGTVTVPPHGDRADVVSTVRLPEAEALAVMAVTNLPFTTASAAVHVPESGVCAT
jgi:hypothetical protein